MEIKTKEYIEDEILIAQTSQAAATKQIAKATWWMSGATIAIAIASGIALILAIIEMAICPC